MNKIKYNFNFPKERILKIFTYITIICLIGLYTAFWFHPEYYTASASEAEAAISMIQIKRILFVTLIIFFSILLLLKRNTLSDKRNKILSVIIFAATPLVTFMALEYANIMQSPILFQVFSTLRNRAILYTFWILGLLLPGLYVISNSTKAASLILSILICILGLVNYFVYSFRGIPILATDLTIAGTALNVMSEYNYTLSYEPYVLILITVFWCICICKLRSYKGLRIRFRIPAVVIYFLLLSISIYTLVFTDFLRGKNITINTFKPQKSYAKNGTILTFARSIQFLLVEKPEGYTLETAKEIAGEYTAVSTQDANTPNVIIIMDEAFAALQDIKDFKTNKEVTPFFNSLEENTVRGDMYVSIFGGQTANTEFEILTGNSKAFIPPSSTPYQLYIKKAFPSLNYTLKEQGYQGMIAMHPYNPKGYNRETVYPLLGFETFLSSVDFENPKLIRNYISDETDFERIISEYESAKADSDAPFYLFNVTMQNHSSYAKDFDNLPQDITITDPEFKDDQAERYLNLIHLSDKALEKLITYFESETEPTVIVFFGDHEPAIRESFYTSLFGKPSDKLSSEELMEKYKVPYIIWANYDIEEKNITTSSNYLSTLMLESTGMKMAGYNQFLSEISKEIPVLTSHGYWGADGTYYSLTDTDSPYYESIKKYNILQYNNMFDKGNRIENFFQ